MSYSITVRGKSRHEATQRALAALATNLAGQEAHSRDANAAAVSIEGHVAAVDEPQDGNEIVVEAHGSVSGSWANFVLAACTGAQHSVRVYHAPAAIKP